MTPIFVTGATGTVGAAVLQHLLAARQPVRAGVRHPGQQPIAGVEIVGFDFAQPATFAAALHGVKQVFLMRPPDISNTKRYINPFIDVAKAAGVEHIVFLSLLGAAKIPIVPHHQVEQYLQHSGMVWTFLRPSFFMQNLTTTHLADIRDASRIIVPAGHGRTSFVDARDIAAVAAVTLTQPGHRGQAYDLTGDAALTYDEVAALMSTILGRPIIYTHPSLATFVRHMRGQGFSYSFILVMAGIYTTARLGLATTVTTEITRLLARPPTTMRQFIIDSQLLWQPAVTALPALPALVRR